MEKTNTRNLAPGQKIAKALCKAQAEMNKVAKDKKNPFFKSNYADINNFLSVCKKPLNDNGIILMQPLDYDIEGKAFVKTILLHDSGEILESGSTHIICQKQNDPQAFGAAITYFRRYSLQSMLAMEADDCDGEKAMDRSQKKTNVVQKQAAPNQNLITLGQQKRLFAITKKHNWEQADVKEYLLKEYGYTSSKEIQKQDYDKIITFIEDHS